MNLALSQEFHLFCEQEQLQKHATLDKNPYYCLYGTLEEDGWFGRLDDGSPKVKWMRRVHPRVDYTQAPWTVVMLRQPSQSIHTLREAYTFRRRFRIPYAVLWTPVLVGNTAEVV